jgi:raffinose/stachyose/melibiose transport system substrate-binding protein
MADPITRRDMIKRATAVGATLALPAAFGAKLARATALGSPNPAKLTVWLAGYGTGAKAGTPLRKWVDDQAKRFSAKFPGSSIEYVVQSANNAQFLPVLRSAFAARNVPDVMMLYSGGYTVDYAESLLDLRPKINSAFFNQFNAWDLSCQNFNCGANAPIYGVPNDVGGFVLFYNKALFRKAGIPARPFRTWNEMLAAARKLKAAGVIPFAMGNRDGYSAANWVAVMLGSYISGVGDINKWRTGELKWTDPKMVRAVDRYDQLWTLGFSNPDARTREQLDANNDFISEKAAMVLMYPSLVVDFRKGLGQKLALMKLPAAANGPLSHAMNVISGQDWVIPKDAKNPDLAWEFVKLVTDQKSQTEQLLRVATPPANRQVNLKLVKDPILQTFLKLLQEKPSFPLIDSVVQADVATVWYAQLNLAFAGKASAEDAMAKVEEAAKTSRG